MGSFGFAKICGLDGGSRIAWLAYFVFASEMGLADLPTVTSIAYLAGLGFLGHLANTVFANEVGATSIGGVTEVAFATKDAVALRRNVRIQLNKREVRKT